MNNLNMPHIKITRRDLLVMISEEVESNAALTPEDRNNTEKREGGGGLGAGTGAFWLAASLPWSAGTLARVFASPLPLQRDSFPKGQRRLAG